MFSGEETTPSVDGSGTAQNQPHSVRQEDKVAEISSVKVSSAGSLGVLILIATIIGILGTGGFYVYKISRQTKLDEAIKKYNNLTTEVNSSDLKKLASDLQEIQDGQKSLKDAMDSRVYWSKFWNRLSAVTPKNVFLGSLSIDEANTVSLNGSAPDLTSIAKYMVSMKKSPLFSDIKLGNTSVKNQAGGPGLTAFAITFKINPEELLNKEVVLGGSNGQ